MKNVNCGNILIAGAFLLLAGCSSSDDPDPADTTNPPDTGDTNGGGPAVPVAQRYEVQLTNLTNGQSFSEALLMVHPSNELLWQIGQPASTELEELAESGSNSGMSSLASGSSFAVSAGDSVLSPGGTQTLSISNSDAANTSLTVLTRMQQTDDGFTGANAIDLSQLSAGQSISLDRWALDAGTQKNLESVNLGSLDPVRPSVPNDINGSEFNHVSVHPGVLTEISPLSDNTSQLNQQRKFDNPVIRIRITRLDS